MAESSQKAIGIKLNWVSPLPPAETDIGNYTRRILPALSECFQITLWHDQDVVEPDMYNYADIKRFPRNDPPGSFWKELNSADLTCYNIGNNSRFHANVWRISQRHPGVVILHDINLQHLFAGLYRDTLMDKEGYLRKMALCYGAAGRKTAEDFWEMKCSTENLAVRFPLTPLAIENALGIVVHTKDGFERLRETARCPLAYIPLPYAVTGREDTLSRDHRKSKKPYRLIVFGYLGKNRRLEQILEAISTYENRRLFRLDIYGKIWDQNLVVRKIKKLGLENSVKVHGFVSENALDDALASADLAINLRYPSMGEASGSQLRIWDHALPSLVTNTAWYARLPHEAVCPVNPDNEDRDIQRHLEGFLRDPKRFEEMGRFGRKILEEQHSPGSYVIALSRFFGQVSTNAVYWHMDYYSKRIADAIHVWESEGGRKYQKRLANEVIRLFGKSPG